jgi:hypothetical protein
MNQVCEVSHTGEYFRADLNYEPSTPQLAEPLGTNSLLEATSNVECKFDADIVIVTEVDGGIQQNAEVAHLVDQLEARTEAMQEQIVELTRLLATRGDDVHHDISVPNAAVVSILNDSAAISDSACVEVDAVDIDIDVAADVPVFAAAVGISDTLTSSPGNVDVDVNVNVDIDADVVTATINATSGEVTTSPGGEVNEDAIVLFDEDDGEGAPGTESTESVDDATDDGSILLSDKTASSLDAERGLYLQSTMKMLECYHQDLQKLDSLIPVIDCALSPEAIPDDMRNMLREVRATIASCYSPWAYSPDSCEPSGWILKQAEQVTLLSI